MLTIHTALIAIDNIFRFDNNHRREAYQLERGEGGRTAAAFRPVPSSRLLRLALRPPDKRQLLSILSFSLF